MDASVLMAGTSDSYLFLSCLLPFLIGSSHLPPGRATSICTLIQHIFMMHVLCVSGSVLDAEGAAGNKTDPHPHSHNTAIHKRNEQGGNRTNVVNKMHGKLEGEECYGKAAEGGSLGRSTVVAILNRVVSASLIEKAIFKQRLVRGEGGIIWILGVRASQAGE